MRKQNRMGNDTIARLLGIGEPFHCCHFGGGGGSAPAAPPQDNTMEMMAMFNQQAQEQERRFQAMEAARMEQMMEMEAMRLAHEEKLRTQMKKAELMEARNLEEAQMFTAEEAEEISYQQDVETPEGITINWMSALQHGMEGELYGEDLAYPD